MLFFFFYPKRDKWHLSAPACLGGCWVRCGGVLPWQGSYCQENLAPAAAGNPGAIFGLGMAWSRLGHGLGMSCAEMLLQNLGLLGNCGGSTKGFGLKEMMQNDAGWCSPPCPKFKAGISQCLFFLPPRPRYCFPAIGMML